MYDATLLRPQRSCSLCRLENVAKEIYLFFNTKYSDLKLKNKPENVGRTKSCSKDVHSLARRIFISINIIYSDEGR